MRWGGRHWISDTASADGSTFTAHSELDGEGAHVATGEMSRGTNLEARVCNGCSPAFSSIDRGHRSGDGTTRWNGGRGAGYLPTCNDRKLDGSLIPPNTRRFGNLKMPWAFLIYQRHRHISRGSVVDQNEQWNGGDRVSVFPREQSVQEV